MSETQERSAACCRNSSETQERSAACCRKTRETDVEVKLTIGCTGDVALDTGIGFFDHMLELLARHGGMSLSVKAKGDLRVDGHHTVEDIGIVTGKALAEALGDKKGIRRYGCAVIPMDEALATCALDISGRPFIVFDAKYTGEKVGDFDTELAQEFFRALAFAAGLTLHLRCDYGGNDHHKIEAMFKAFARAFREASSIDPDAPDEIPSSKGVL
jgi:imidazoleglycerol-phosphate dehydratase